MEETVQVSTDEPIVPAEPQVTDAPPLPVVEQTGTASQQTESVEAFPDHQTTESLEAIETKEPPEPAQTVLVESQYTASAPVVETPQEDMKSQASVATPDRSAMPEPAQPVAVGNAPQPPLKVRGGDEGGVMLEDNDAEVEPSAQTVEPTGKVKEKIVERVRDLNEAEKEQIFRDKLKTLSPRGVSARRQKKHANLDKILAHLRQHGYITNDEVEELCKVKDNTAYKYLAELEKQGLLMQLGRTGRRVRYRLTSAIP